MSSATSSIPATSYPAPVARSQVDEEVRRAVRREHCRLRFSDVLDEDYQIRFVRAGDATERGRIQERLARTACWSYIVKPHNDPYHLILIGNRFGEAMRPEAQSDDLLKSAFAIALYRHEIGHSIYTTRDYRRVAEEAAAVGVSPLALNIAEDARIEDRCRRDMRFNFDWQTMQDAPRVDAKRPEWLLLAPIYYEGREFESREHLRECGVSDEDVDKVLAFYDEITSADSTEEMIPLMVRYLEAFGISMPSTPPAVPPPVDPAGSTGSGADPTSSSSEASPPCDPTGGSPGEPSPSPASEPTGEEESEASDSEGAEPAEASSPGPRFTGAGTRVPAGAESQLTEPPAVPDGSGEDVGDLQLGLELGEEQELQQVLAASDSLDLTPGRNVTPAIGMLDTTSTDCLSGDPIITLGHLEHPIERDRLERCVKTLEQAFRGKWTHSSTDAPTKRLNLKRAAADQDRIYDRREAGDHLGRNRFLLLVDCSGSMSTGDDHLPSGSPIGDARLFVAVINDLVRRGRIEGHVLLTKLEHGAHLHQVMTLPCDVSLIGRIPADGDGEGIATTLERNYGLVHDADITALFTDGQVTDQPVDKERLHRQGIFTYGLYAGQEQQAERLHLHTDHQIVSKDLETLVTRFAAALLTRSKRTKQR